MAETLEQPSLHQLERDLGLERRVTSQLEHAEFGSFMRKLGGVATTFRQFERQTHAPERSNTMTARETSNYALQRRDFERRMNRLDAFIGKTLTETIYFASEPHPPMTAPNIVLLRAGEPSLYYEYWRTQDLDDTTRDPVEIRMFVDLDNNLETPQGVQIINAVLGHLLVDDYADASFKMARKNMPDDWQTFGTVSRAIFEPFTAT